MIGFYSAKSLQKESFFFFWISDYHQEILRLLVSSLDLWFHLALLYYGSTWRLDFLLFRSLVSMVCSEVGSPSIMQKLFLLWSEGIFTRLLREWSAEAVLLCAEALKK
ncbi:unnamed protein product [Ilex paraguariensis]|uniref:Uncharacterized protein n=1 Tax=Ilex paraguariensis TaxID=185542 RepID=A0ABC8RUI4_9AQUA